MKIVKSTLVLSFLCISGVTVSSSEAPYAFINKKFPIGSLTSFEDIMKSDPHNGMSEKIIWEREEGYTSLVAPIMMKGLINYNRRRSVVIKYGENSELNAQKMVCKELFHRIADKKESDCFIQ